MELTSIIVAFLTGVAGPIGVLYVKNYLQSRKPNSDMVTEAAEVGSLISTKIDDLKEEYGADRVWVAQFHNGGHFYPTGKSIAKFSIFYETVQAGVASIQSNFQNIPVNLFSKAINRLLEEEVIEIFDYKDEKIATYGLKYIAEESGCKSTYMFAIRNFEGKFIGILSIDYTRRKMNLDQEKIFELSNHATSMGGVLMQHLNKK